MNSIKEFILWIATISIPIIIVVFGVIWRLIVEIKMTFREERKENARQFLYQNRLESIREILNCINRAFWLIHESYTKVYKHNYLEKEYKFFKSTHDAALEIDDINMYIDFIPEMKELLYKINKELDDYRVKTMSIFNELVESKVHQQQTSKKQDEIHKLMSEFKKEIILIYEEKINDIVKISK